ncbi:MAG: type IV secretion system protein [Campylobacteraceae bacterium]|jgi:type IV secretion system protein VirB8|nr:type IV secretion system protein [Campylobacteraceae bacterium]
MKTLLDKLAASNKSSKTSEIPKEIDKNALDFEQSVAYMVAISNKRAWTVTFAALTVTFLLAIALILLAPLKTVEPYVIRYDSTTGHTDIATALTQQNLRVDEAVSKYFVSKYVKLRESYYFETLQQDYNLVQLFGTEPVNNEYRMIYSGDNSRDVRLGNNAVEKVEIASVVLGQSAGIDTATVRIRILRYDKKDMKVASRERNKIVTLTYEYAPDKTMKEFYRLNNPLGFRIKSYRIDDEVVR